MSSMNMLLHGPLTPQDDLTQHAKHLQSASLHSLHSISCLSASQSTKSDTSFCNSLRLTFVTRHSVSVSPPVDICTSHSAPASAVADIDAQTSRKSSIPPDKQNFVPGSPVVQLQSAGGVSQSADIIAASPSGCLDALPGASPGLSVPCSNRGNANDLLAADAKFSIKCHLNTHSDSATDKSTQPVHDNGVLLLSEATACHDEKSGAKGVAPTPISLPICTVVCTCTLILFIPSIFWEKLWLAASKMLKGHAQSQTFCLVAASFDFQSHCLGPSGSESYDDDSAAAVESYSVPDGLEVVLASAMQHNTMQGTEPLSTIKEQEQVPGYMHASGCVHSANVIICSEISQVWACSSDMHISLAAHDDVNDGVDPHNQDETASASNSKPSLLLSPPDDEQMSIEGDPDSASPPQSPLVVGLISSAMASSRTAAQVA